MIKECLPNECGAGSKVGGAIHRAYYSLNTMKCFVLSISDSVYQPVPTPDLHNLPLVFSTFGSYVKGYFT
jgi:hypothetical protein